MEEKHKRATKIFVAVQALFAIGAFLFIYFSGHSASAPIVGQSIFEPDLTFEVSSGEQLLISTTPDFENPMIFREGSNVQLAPGTYYWKTKSWNGESEVKTFVVKDRVVSGVIDRGSEATGKSGITSISIDAGKSVETGGNNG